MMGSGDSENASGADMTGIVSGAAEGSIAGSRKRDSVRCEGT